MPDYLVDSTLQFNDKATAQLNRLIGVIQKAHKAVSDLNNMLGMTAQRMSPMGVLVGDLNREITGMGTRMRTTTDRSAQFATSLENVQRAGLQTTFVMADMATESERVATTMREAATATAQAGRAAATARSQFGRFGLGGGSTAGGGRGGHASGIGGAMRAGAMGALGLGRGVAGFAGHATNAALMAMLGLDLAREGLSPGLDYLAQQAKFKTVGVGGAEQALAKKEAERIATQLGVSSPANVLSDIFHMYGVTKSMPLAIQQAERMSKGEAVIASLGERFPNLKGNERELSSTILKAAEQTGNVAFHDKDFQGVARFTKFLNNAIRMLAVEGGNVSPESFKQAMTSLRSARFGKSDEFLFADLAFFLSEAGGKGGRTGMVGSMFSTLSQHLVLGNLNKAEAAHMMQLGLMRTTDDQGRKILDPQDKHFQNTLKTLMVHPENMIKDYSLLTRDPGMWLMTTWKDAVVKSAQQTGQLRATTFEGAKTEMEKLSDEQRLRIVAPHLQGSPKTEVDLMLQYAFRSQGIMENRARFNRAPSADQMFSSAMDSLPMNLNRVNKEFETMAQLLGDRLGPLLNSTLKGTADILQQVNQLIINFGNRFPGLTRLVELLSRALGDMWNFLAPHIANILGTSVEGYENMAALVMGPGTGPTPTTSQILGKGKRPFAGMPTTSSMVPPPPPNIPTLDQLNLSQRGVITPGALGQMQFRAGDVHFHGPVNDPHHVAKVVRQTQGDMLRQFARDFRNRGILHSATTPQAASMTSAAPLSGTQGSN